MLARAMLRLFKGLLPASCSKRRSGAVGFLPVSEENAVMIVAFAMGLQASTITSFAGHSVSTVVVTSTLARTADAAVDRLWRGAATPPPSALNTGLLALTWTGYLVGAVIGGLLLPVLAWPLLVPAALLILIAAVALSGYAVAIAFSTNILRSNSSATLPSLARTSATSILA